MSDAKHTPEPWVGGNSTNTGAHELIGDGQQLVALVYGRTKEEQDANLALLTAAVRLLAELKNLSRAYVSLMEAGRDRIIMLGGDCDSVDRMEEGDPSLRSARAVIAKATGAA